MLFDNYRTMFESRIFQGATEKLPCPEKERISSLSYDMEGQAKKCVEQYCELANKTTQQLSKISTLCLDDHHFKEEELKSVGELSKVCSQIVLKCLYMARIGRLDSLLVNQQICPINHQVDENLWQMIISFDLLHSSHMWSQTTLVCGKHCKNEDWDCFKIPILQEILRIQNPLLEEHCAFLEVIHLFQSVGCVKNKLQIRTVQQNQKSFPSMQDWGWTVNPHLIYGIWSSQFFKKSHGMIDDLDNVRKLCCMFLKTTKQWSRWSQGEEALQWDMCQELLTRLKE